MTLVERLQQDQATELIRQVMAGRTVDAAQLTVVSSRELTAAVGRRRVVQYVVDGLDDPGPTLLIAKTFSEPHRAQMLSTHLQELADNGFAVGRFRVPQLLAFDPEEHLVLYRACTGTPLNEQMDNENLLDGVRDAARWLAKLHTSAVQLPRTFSVAQEVSSTQEWAAVVGRHSPDVLEPAQRLAGWWATAGSSFRAAPVPIHKDFHAGHVLMGRLIPGHRPRRGTDGRPALSTSRTSARIWSSEATRLASDSKPSSTSTPADRLVRRGLAGAVTARTRG